MERTRGSRSLSSGLGFPMAARRFLCSVALYSAWLRCGADWVAKGEVMKSLSRKLLPLILFAIAVASLFSVQPAQAYTVTLKQIGSNVVANGSGAINLTGLTFFEINTVEAGVGGFFG